MRRLLKILGITLALLLAVAVAGTAWLWWSNRDIPVADLEQRYGASNLQQVEIDGVQLRYTVDGEGPPLVLLHSHFYNMRQWQPWVDALSDQFTLIRYDKPTGAHVFMVPKRTVEIVVDQPQWRGRATAGPNVSEVELKLEAK